MSLIGKSSSINTDIEADTLNITETITLNDKIFFQNATNKQKIHGNSSGDLSLFTNAVERMTIVSAGSIGIGTDTPLSNLHIKENNSTINQLRLENGHLDGSTGISLHNGTDAFTLQLDNTDNRIKMYNGMGGINYTAPEGDHRFYKGYINSPIEQMRIRNDGKVDIMCELKCSSTTDYFLPNKLTTTQQDALTPVAGSVIYNTSTNKLRCYNGTIWNDCF